MEDEAYEIKIDPERSKALCWTCLTSNREVVELGQYKDMFCHLLQWNSSEEATAWLEEMRICWECVALLRRVSEFHARAVRATEILETARRCDVVNLKFESMSNIQKSSTKTLTIKPEIIIEMERAVKNFDDMVNLDYQRSEDCDDITKTLDTLPRYQKTHKMMKFKPFMSTTRRKRKISIQREPTPERSTNTSNIFICNACHRVFRSKSDITLHLLTNHPGVPQRCRYCDLVVADRDQLNQHLQNVHNAAAKLKWPCPQCGKVYSAKQNMTNHLRFVHEKITNYFCSQHKRYFLDSKSLKTHYQSLQHGVPPPRTHPCPYCGRLMRDSSNLLNHIRTHTGERPFECPYCSSSFAQRTAMLAHVKHVHMNEPRRKYVKKHERKESISQDEDDIKPDYITSDNIGDHIINDNHGQMFDDSAEIAGEIERIMDENDEDDILDDDLENITDDNNPDHIIDDSQDANILNTKDTDISDAITNDIQNTKEGITNDNQDYSQNAPYDDSINNDNTGIITDHSQDSIINDHRDDNHDMAIEKLDDDIMPDYINDDDSYDGKSDFVIQDKDL